MNISKFSVIVIGGAQVGKTVFCNGLLSGFDEYSTNKDSKNPNSVRVPHSYIVKTEINECDISIESDVYTTYSKPSNYLYDFMISKNIKEIEVIELPSFNDRTVDDNPIDISLRSDILGILVFSNGCISNKVIYGKLLEKLSICYPERVPIF